MTFRELAMQEETAPMGASFLQEDERNFFQSLLHNQSPVMKLWFAIMVINLVLFLFVL